MDTSFLHQVVRVSDSAARSLFHITEEMYDTFARYIVVKATEHVAEDADLRVSGNGIEFDFDDVTMWLTYTVDFLFSSHSGRKIGAPYAVPDPAIGEVKKVSIVSAELEVGNPEWDGVEEGVPETVESDFNIDDLKHAIEDFAAGTF